MTHASDTPPFQVGDRVIGRWYRQKHFVVQGIHRNPSFGSGWAVEVDNKFPAARWHDSSWFSKDPMAPGSDWWFAERPEKVPEKQTPEDVRPWMIQDLTKKIVSLQHQLGSKEARILCLERSLKDVVGSLRESAQILMSAAWNLEERTDIDPEEHASGL